MNRTEAKKDELRYWHLLFHLSLEEALRMGRVQIKQDLTIAKMPMKMDFLVVRSRAEEELNHPIAQIFRKLNVIEYKSPAAPLKPIDYLKGILYLRQYQYTYHAKDFYFNDFSLTFISTKRPSKVFELVGVTNRIVEHSPIRGVYQIADECWPTQIVVLNELSDLEVAYPFAPFLTGKTRWSLKPFVRLFEESLMRGGDEKIKRIIDYAIEHSLIEKYEWEEVLAMRLKKEEALRKRREEFLQVTRDSWLGECLMEEGEQRGQRNLIKTALLNGAEVSYLVKVTGYSHDEIMKIHSELLM